MEFESALTAIERAKSVDDLSKVLFDWRDESGVAHLVYHAAHVPACQKPNPLLLLTYDGGWVKRYVEQDYFRIDPVVIAGRSGFLPIDWLPSTTTRQRRATSSRKPRATASAATALRCRSGGQPASARCSRSPQMRRTSIGTGGDVLICRISTFWRTTFTIVPCAWPACGLTMQCERYRAASNNACNT
jgi:hypothetical protein